MAPWTSTKGSGSGVMDAPPPPDDTPNQTGGFALREHTKTPDWDASRFPYYKRFARDYLSSGRLAMMSHLQRSIYSVLLDRAWVEDGLPQEPRRLAAMGLATPAELEEAWTFPLDEAFTVGQDGRLRNPRMEVERADAVRLRDARSRGGSKSPRSVLQESSAPPRSDPEESANKPQAQAQSENTPLTPQGGALSSPSDLARLVGSWWPGSRLARDGGSTAASWAQEVAEASLPLEALALATARLRESGAKRVPKPGEVIAKAHAAIGEVEGGALPLATVVDLPGDLPPWTVPYLEALGVEQHSRAKDWPAGAAARWRRMAGGHLLACAWNKHPLNPEKS